MRYSAHGDGWQAGCRKAEDEPRFTPLRATQGTLFVALELYGSSSVSSSASSGSWLPDLILLLGTFTSPFPWNFYPEEEFHFASRENSTFLFLCHFLLQLLLSSKWSNPLGSIITCTFKDRLLESDCSGPRDRVNADASVTVNYINLSLTFLL